MPVLGHVPNVVLGGLMALWVAARGPENTRNKDGHNDGHYDERGSDVHGDRSLPIRLAKQF